MVARDGGMQIAAGGGRSTALSTTVLTEYLLTTQGIHTEHLFFGGVLQGTALKLSWGSGQRKGLISSALWRPDHGHRSPAGKEGVLLVSF